MTDTPRTLDNEDITLALLVVVNALTTELQARGVLDTEAAASIYNKARAMVASRPDADRVMKAIDEILPITPA